MELNYWSQEEIEILLNNKDKTIQELLKLLPNRNLHGIHSKARRLHVDYKHNRLDDKLVNGKVKCNKCNTEKEWNDSNYNTNDHLFICKSFINKISNIRKYKRKYNIDLDFDKMIDTYTEIEWYEMYLNNKIPALPQSVYYSELKILSIMKYIFEDKMNVKTKNQLVNVNTTDLAKYKGKNIFHNILMKNFKYPNYFSLLTTLYPEYNLQPFELKLTSKDYWSSKDNADNCMRYYIESIKNNDVNFRKNLSKYFSFAFLREIKYNMLINCIHIYKHYNNFYEWINQLYPEWELTSKDFNLCLGYDGISKLDSIEEKIIFDFIYNDLNIKYIKAVGTTRRTKYFSKEFKENYYPDFIIEKTDTFKFNKPLIIEYYGFYYTDIDYDIFKTYIGKTKRKNKYYKSNKDIYFIDLYPEDLKNNCEGVRRKLTSFFMQNFNVDINDK